MRKKNNAIIFYILIFLLELLLFRFASSDTTNFNKILIILVILFNSIIIGGSLLKKSREDNKNIYFIIFLSYIIRTVVMALDLLGYTSGFTGADTERFYNYAIYGVESSVNYINFLKAFFYIFGVSRVVAQYFNVIVSLFSILLLYKSMLILNLKKSIITATICIFAFSPPNILLSAALLREPLMIFLNTLSLFLFLKWYKSGGLKYCILSIICIFISAWFHSGMISAIVLYCFVLPFYNREKNKIIIKKNSLFIIIILFIGLFVSYMYFGKSLLSYFDRINDVSDITARNSIGNTDYLNFLNNVTSIYMILLFLPLKIFYFYFSPMPWDCYSISVACVFIFSSTIYIYLFYNILKKRSTNSTLKKVMLLLLFSLSFVYALGVSNAGTAMRHREKMLPFLLITYAISNKKGKGDANENSF